MRLGCYRERWTVDRRKKAGLIGPTHPRMGKIALHVLRTKRVNGQQLFLEDEISIGIVHG